jgi:hypothetical protein
VIVNGLLSLITSALTFFFSLIPSWHIPGFLTSGSVISSSVASTLGGYLTVVQPYMPVDTILNVTASVFDLWPSIVGYLVFQWAWDHVPTIAGFGTGND